MSTSPYPGLRPFHRDEADIFFGRDEQVDQLLLRLGKSRFLAVVGPSGCGKSSLVHTGLLNALEAGFLAEVGLHWRIATMQPGSHPMRNLASALAGQVNAVGLSSSKPSPEGEGWVRGNQANEKSVIINPHPNLLPEGEGAHDLKSTAWVEQVGLGTDTNPPSESEITSFSDTATETANKTPRHDNTAFLLATLRRGPLGLIEALREQPLPEQTNLLLVVDQFEEIFRYREHQDRDEADAFVALLLRSVIENELPVYVVITMRSDFLGDCALFPGLPEALNDSQFLTPRLNREQRRLAIIGPAKVFGGDVEPALVNRLLNDMGADPDQLPVLQHALMRLWTEACKRDNNPASLKLDDYETLGGWDNTLSNHADEAFAELDKQQQRIAEIVFRSLTERSGAKRDTRRPVSLQTVADVAGVELEQVKPVIEVFRRGDRSFVMPPEGQPLTAETVIDISHESLIRQWQRMKTWVEQEARSADTYRRLEQTALLHSEKRAGLLQGLDLFPVIEWKKREKPGAAWAARYGEEFDLVMGFLAKSEFWQTLKSIGKVLGVAMVFFTAVWMTWLWQQADSERNKATSSRLLAEAQLVRSQHASLYPLSVLLGIEALKHYPHSNFILNQFLQNSLLMQQKPLHALHHDGEVKQVVYSPDGKWIATASDDNTARLWDAATGKELQRLSHDNIVTAVSFSPDGKQLATASNDKTARLWDVATGKELQRLSHDDGVTAVTFSPDGTQLATASWDNTARLWDAATGKELRRLSHDDGVTAVTFSPDGTQLATASWDNTARLWDAATGKELRRLSHDSGVIAITFSPDGKKIATVSYDKAARLWDAATGKELRRLSHDNGVGVTAISFSSDGKQLATASRDNTARLWDVATGKELQRLSHDDDVTDVSFNPDGQRLATASVDNTARQWDAATGKELQRLSHDNFVKAVSFSPDGKQLATASGDKTARLWDAAAGKELQGLSHDNVVTAVSFSPGGKQLATASDDNTARLWDAATGKELQRLSHDDDVTDVSFSPDGKQLATASDDKTARLWDVATGKELQRLSHGDVVSAVSFSPDGQRLATASDDNTARLWDAATGKELQRLSHDNYVTAVSFSPDGKQLATTSWDTDIWQKKTERLWDAATGKELRRFSRDANVYSVSFSPDGKLLATASGGSAARLWDAASGKELQSLIHDNGVTDVSFSPDGKLLATASNDNTVRLWDAATGKELQRLSHDDHVTDVSFSHDGKLLATASADNTVRLWDAATGKELQRLSHDRVVTAVTFSPDDKQLALVSNDKTARLWLWQPHDLVIKLCKGRLLYNLGWSQWREHLPDEPFSKTCDKLPVNPDFQEQGRQLVKEGKNDEAIRMIKELNTAYPSLQLNPENEIQKWTALLRLTEAERLLQEHKIAEAIAALKEVEQMDAAFVTAKLWNYLCWHGALADSSPQVLFACDKAVTEAKNDALWMYRDSRGLARALTGDSQGAIEDFEFFIEKTGDEKHKKQRQAWVQALRASQNPFTKEELDKLRNQ